MNYKEKIAELEKQLAAKQEIVEEITKENSFLHIKLNVAKEALQVISRYKPQDITKIIEDQSFIACEALFKIDS